jgi:hypothetical protein
MQQKYALEPDNSEADARSISGRQECFHFSLKKKKKKKWTPLVYLLSIETTGALHFAAR